MNGNPHKKYLISVSIGPVQDFIASARRSRDLWFGSWLLSELSAVVAKKIGETRLIFPSSLSGNVVNKILATVDNVDNIESDCRTAILERLKEISGTIFEEIEGKLGKDKSSFYRAKAEAQINDMPEFYWAAIPFDENKDDYKVCRERVEILLNARKSTRNFDEASWASHAPKSSLDGQRESVIEDSKIDDVKIQRIFNLRKKERLCGVGVLKRLAEKKAYQSFASTSHMASLPLLATLTDTQEIRNAIQDYISEITNLIFEIEDKELGKVPGYLEHAVFGKYDGHLLYENRLADLPFENGNLDKAKQALRAFMETAFGDANKKPSPYFALLLADGDRMGSVIDYQNTRGDHRKLSEALSVFAGKVEEIVEQYKGCLIYAGGDDVLAMLPLHTVLKCSGDLATSFADGLKGFVDKDGNTPTLSAGVAIVHHTEPLQESLETMRRAEQVAKAVDGKNALAVILSKRSGVNTTIKGKWVNDRNTGKAFDERLRWFIQLHLDDALPDGVAYEIRDLWLRFKDTENMEIPMRKEAVRILRRKRSNHGLTRVSQEILDHMEPLVMQTEFSLEDLANEIIVARDFANVHKQVGEQAVHEMKKEASE